MRSEFSELYQRVYREYGLDAHMNNGRRAKINGFLRYQFKKMYGEQRWSDLHAVEQDYFIYEHIRDAMFKYYLCGRSKTQLEELRKVLNGKADESHLLAAKELSDRNRVDIFKKYDLSDCSEEEILDMYKDFHKAFFAFNPKFPIPSFDEWKNDPRRIYDFIKESEETHPDEYDSIPTDGEVDHFIVKAILKILADNWKIGVDVKQIEECLAQCKKHPLDDYEKIHVAIEPDSSLSYDEQERLVENNIKTEESLLKLDSMTSFIYDIDDYDEEESRLSNN